MDTRRALAFRRFLSHLRGTEINVRPGDTLWGWNRSLGIPAASSRALARKTGDGSNPTISPTFGQWASSREMAPDPHPISNTRAASGKSTEAKNFSRIARERESAARSSIALMRTPSRLGSTVVVRVGIGHRQQLRSERRLPLVTITAAAPVEAASRSSID